MRITTAALLFVPFLFAADVASLIRSEQARLLQLARVLVLHDWSGRIDGLFASRGAFRKAPPAWKSGDAHWERARGQFLETMGRRIDQLAGDPEVQRLISNRFSSQLNDAQASAVASRLKQPLGPEIDNYSDYLILSVAAASESKEGNVLDPGVRAVAKTLTEQAKAHTPPDSKALYEAQKDSVIERYFRAREFSVRALRTGLDGQLQLCFNDAQASFAANVDAAIEACRKGHSGG